MSDANSDPTSTIEVSWKLEKGRTTTKMEESQSVKESSGGMVLGRRSIQWTAVFVGCELLFIVWSTLGGSIAGSAILFLPSLIFLPAFVIGNIYSIRAISSDLVNAKKQGKWSLRALWISLVVFVVAAIINAPTIKRVAGTYEGGFYGVSEVLELRLDGTFTQNLSLPAGDLRTAEGFWKVEGQTVVLGNYLCFINDENLRALIPPEMCSGVTYVYSSGMLIRDWDSGYYVSRRR